MDESKDIFSRPGSDPAGPMGAGRAPRAEAPPAATEAPRRDGAARLEAGAEIDIDRIAPDPGQPRTEFEAGALGRLAESLEAHGQLQPITVRRGDGPGRYLIVAGERRWRAAKLAGRRSLSAVILDGEPGASRVLEMQLVENGLREDLRPIEQARAFRALMDRNGWTASRLAEALHLNGATVSRALALLGLPRAVQEAVASGDLAPSAAYEVSKLGDPEAQREVAGRIVSEGMTRDAAAAAVRRAGGRPGEGAARAREPGPRASRRSRTFKVAGGEVTVENRWGLDDHLVVAMLREAAAMAEAKAKGGGGIRPRWRASAANDPHRTP